jgi:glycosyltransferase involved in cell wall biosynthesis
MPKKLFIHATNVHQGGGRTLLEALLNVLDVNTEFVLTLDERMPIPPHLTNDIRVKRIKPSVSKRLKAERWLARNVTSEDTVLCFGNLPPLFKLRGYAIVFLQNRYLIDDAPLNRFPIRVMLRLALERFWLDSKMLNSSEFIVQTPSMQTLLERKTGERVPVRVLPFVAQPRGYARSLKPLNSGKDMAIDYLYVASGEPHKNHRRLIDAWCLLAEEGLFPSLCLTLDEIRFPELCRLIDEMRCQYGVKVTNAGELLHRDVLELYKKSMASIYPSTFESFGLPLIEARQAGLPVLASELDYVRDVLDPEQSFDPESSVSIARAVKRFMGKDEQTLPLLNATQFMDCVLGKAE